jgi:F-type H+-transporting ATPase subunit delta
MSSTRAAIRYAKAILEIASSKNVANEVSSDMFIIASTIKENAELDTFIQNPTIRVEVKQNALLEVFAQTNAVTKSLFRLLFENNCFRI